MCGLILDKYNQLGGPGGFLGPPTSDELTNPDGVGKRNSFESDSSIYWSSASGAHQIGGAIGAKWGQLGYEGGLGYPTSDELTNPDGFGKRNSFEKGSSIYWSSASGAHQIGGEIGATWAVSGWEGGNLRYPTSDEYVYNEGRRNDFQGGHITWAAPDFNDDWLSTPENLNDPGTELYTASDSTVTVLNEGAQQPAPGDQGGVPFAGPQKISCRAKAHDPHDSSHKNGTENSQITVTCDGLIAGVTAFATTFRDGQAVGTTNKAILAGPKASKPNIVKTNFAVKCVPGTYQTKWYLYVTGLPNYVPRIGPVVQINSPIKYVPCDKQPR